MKEDIKVLEWVITNKLYIDTHNECDYHNIHKAIENLIKGYKELEEYQHNVNEILNLDDDNLDAILVDNCHKGLKKCVTEFEKENHYKTEMINYLDKRHIEDFEFYLETLNNTIPKSKVQEKIEERYGTLCMELGSYVRDEATPEQERIAGGINELRKLKRDLLQEGDK